MKVDQAIFTSLVRRGGMSGYHLTSRSTGVSDAEAGALTTWSPSHGALIVDRDNRTSVNFHSLPTGRFALSRTCEGLPEYSGRGGRQLYTHFLIFDHALLKATAFQPFAIYRDALALGYLRYRPAPESILKPVMLSQVYIRDDEEIWLERAKLWGLPSLDELRQHMERDVQVKYAYAGDRIRLAECVINLLHPEAVPMISFSTSLQPSTVRPYKFCLVGP